MIIVDYLLFLLYAIGAIWFAVVMMRLEAESEEHLNRHVKQLKRDVLIFRGEIYRIGRFEVRRVKTKKVTR